MVKHRGWERFTFEQIVTMPGAIGYRIILCKILTSCGSMPAKELAVFRGMKIWLPQSV